GGEGELRKIRQTLEVVRMHARLIEALPVVRHLLIGMAQGLLEARQLQCPQFILARMFYGVPAPLHFRHGCLPPSSLVFRDDVLSALRLSLPAPRPRCP